MEGEVVVVVLVGPERGCWRIGGLGRFPLGLGRSCCGCCCRRGLPLIYQWCCCFLGTCLFLVFLCGYLYGMLSSYSLGVVLLFQTPDRRSRVV